MISWIKRKIANYKFRKKLLWELRNFPKSSNDDMQIRYFQKEIVSYLSKKP